MLTVPIFTVDVLLNIRRKGPKVKITFLFEMSFRTLEKYEVLERLKTLSVPIFTVDVLLTIMGKSLCSSVWGKGEGKWE